MRWRPSVLTAFTLTIPERAAYGATEARLRGIPTSMHDGNTNRLALWCADHNFSNLAVLLPANADPGLVRLILAKQ